MTEPKHRDFADRLKQACDGNPDVPAPYRGRQSWVAEKLKISHEASRKWFAGLSRPRSDKMRELAKLLNVDEAWLALGQTPTLDPRERRAQANAASGAVEVVAGLVELNGGKVAFPRDDDPQRGFVHFHAIIDGVWSSFHIALGKPVDDNHYRFDVPAEHERCTVLGFIHSRPLRPQLIRMAPELVNRHGINHGGYIEITVASDDGLYTTGEDTWPRVVSFSGVTDKQGVA